MQSPQQNLPPVNSESIYSAPFYKIIVPTVDTVRYDYIVSSLLSNGFPALVVGPVGTGKTSTIRSALELLDDTKYAILLVNMSAQTTSNNVQVPAAGVHQMDNSFKYWIYVLH